jgi:hypothetical protein
MNFSVLRVAGLGAALVAVALVSGCASGVKRSDGQKAGSFQPSAEFPIGKINVAVTDEARNKLKNNFKFNQDQLRNSIQEALTNNQLFKADSGMTLDVLVTRIRVRSTFSAVMWGAMAGNDAVEGEVSVKDASGKPLDKFSVNASYALGGFAGGQDSMRTGWLYEAFAKEVLGQFKPETKGDGKKAK